MCPSWTTTLSRRRDLRPNDPRSFMTLVGPRMANRSWERDQTKRSPLMMRNKHGNGSACPGCGLLGSPPWGQVWKQGIKACACFQTMGSIQAQPKEVMWDPLLLSSPPTEGAKGVRCKQFWEAAECRDLGGLVRTVAAEARSRDVECHLFDYDGPGGWEVPTKYRRPHLDAQQRLRNQPPREGLDSLHSAVANSGPLAQCLYSRIYPGERDGSLPPRSIGGMDPDLSVPTAQTPVHLIHPFWSS